MMAKTTNKEADGPLFSVLSARTYRHLFLAQVTALVGTGLATVALDLLAYDPESLLSPALAALLLLIVSYHALFLGTALSFLGSALLVVSVMLPHAKPTSTQTTIRRKLTIGLRIYLATAEVARTARSESGGRCGKRNGDCEHCRAGA